LEFLPDGTLIYLSGAQFDQTTQAWLDAYAGFGGEPGISLTDDFPTVLMGVDLSQDILSRLDGDWVIALAPSQGSLLAERGGLDFGLLGLFGTSEEAELTQALEDIYDSFSVLGMGMIDQSKGEEGVIYEISDDASTALIFFGINRGYFLLGTGSDLLDEAVSQSRQLIDSDAYQQAARALPGGAKPVFYADVQGLLDEMRQSVPDEDLNSLDQMTEVLKGIRSLAAGQELIGEDIVGTRIIFFSAKDK
jgi:hypothetical protein